MTTPFERIKADRMLPDREGELNRAVEKLVAEGISRDQLDHALALLLDAVRTTGADDREEVIINSVGDRLHGWCHTSRQIMTLPTADEVSDLQGSSCNLGLFREHMRQHVLALIITAR